MVEQIEIAAAVCLILGALVAWLYWQNESEEDKL